MGKEAKYSIIAYFMSKLEHFVLLNMAQQTLKSEQIFYSRPSKRYYRKKPNHWCQRTIVQETRQMIIQWTSTSQCEKSDLNEDDACSCTQRSVQRRETLEHQVNETFLALTISPGRFCDDLYDAVEEY